MHPSSVVLVLLTAVAHVYWNYQVKRSPEPAAYCWWILALGSLLFVPAALAQARPPVVPVAGWYCVAGTGLFYGGYFGLMAASYAREDLSRAYPIARGVAPGATAAWGVLFQHEHPNVPGWLGIAGICLGVLLLALPSPGAGRASFTAGGILAAAGTGLCTSGYSAVDKEGVKHVDPVLYIVLTFAAGAAAMGLVLLLPGVAARGPGSRSGAPPLSHSPTVSLSRLLIAELRRGGFGLVLASIAATGSYLVILWVLQREPVSYVVPVRSMSVLLSLAAGSRLLGEKGGLRRVTGAVLIVLGIITIALRG